MPALTQRGCEDYYIDRDARLSMENSASYKQPENFMREQRVRCGAAPQYRDAVLHPRKMEAADAPLLGVQLNKGNSCRERLAVASLLILDHPSYLGNSPTTEATAGSFPFYLPTLQHLPRRSQFVSYLLPFPIVSGCIQLAKHAE
jgi:hypothetical protein